MISSLRMHHAALLVTACALAALVGATPQYGAMRNLSPRIAVPGLFLEARDGVCTTSNSHSCLEVNATDSCCPNTEYCIIQQDLTPGCCALSSSCGIPLCDVDIEYLCTTTVTLTITPSSSSPSSSSPLSNTAAPTTTVKTTTACCPRSCTATSQFLCPSTSGGGAPGCCALGSSCGPSGSCVSTLSASPSAIASAVPSGCSAVGQFSCAASLGGGCCATGQACVVVSGSDYCSGSATSLLLTRTGPGGAIATAVEKGDGQKGLSSGAKAGIGVGVSVGAFAVVGALLWFCLVHRQRASGARSEYSRDPYQSHADEMAETGGGRARGRGVLAALSQRHGAARTRTRTRTAPSPQAVSGGQPSDYFGPSGVSGRYTDTEVGEEYGSQAMSPGSERRGAVPATPHTPGDIAAPVEIDDTKRQSREKSNLPTPGEYHKKESESEQGAVELP